MNAAAWVAGSVRARALVHRRIGAGPARQLAACRNADEAVAALAETPYRRYVHSGQSDAEAEHGLGATLLWHLRVLAGWLPPRGVAPLRVLAGWFELANVEERVASLTGRPAVDPYRLGALATAWPRLAGASSLDAVRTTLAASAWGDPGAATPRAIAVGLRLGWAERVAAAAPQARPWAVGAATLLVARELIAAGRPLAGPLARRAEAMLGAAALRADTLSQLAAAVPAAGRWALDGVVEPTQLWRAEAAWWGRVETDGFRLLKESRFDERAVVGAVAVLAVDAWRARAALACAARGGAVEVFDALS